MRQKKTWTEEQLREAVATSTSFASLLKKMGLQPGSRRYLQEAIRKLGLDVSSYKAGPEKKLCSDDRLRELVVSSKSATDILRALGVDLHSNNFYKIRRRIGLLGLDTSHFIRERGERTDGHTRWSNDELRQAVASSRSYAQAIRSLGVIPAGGNYDTIRRRIRELGIDTSHFTSKGWNKGLFTPVPAFPLDQVLVAGRWTSSHGLKKRLIKKA